MKILKRLLSICLSVAMLSTVLIMPVRAASTSITIKSSNKELYFVKNTTGTYGGSGSLGSSYAHFRRTASLIVPIKVDKTAMYSVSPYMKVTGTASYNYAGILFWDYIAESELKTDEINTTYAMAAHAAITDYNYEYYDYSVGGSFAYHNMGKNILLEANKQYYLKIYASRISHSQAIYMSSMKIEETGSPLSSLTIAGAEIVPEFDGVQTDYTVYTEMPSSGKLTISATAVKSDTIVNINAAEGIGSASEDIVVNYGKNQTSVPVVVTDSDGNIYNYNFKIVVREKNDVALGNTTATHSGLATSTGLNNLFTAGGATSKKVAIAANTAGYIQVDLGRAYNLCKFEWTYSEGYPIPLTILASNDEQFSEPVTLGTAQSGKTSCSLDYNEKYRFVRISKDMALTSAVTGKEYYFYPTSLRIYALADVEEETNTSTTVTVPSRYYTVGEQLIAATYNSNGRLIGADIKPAANAYETKLNITKASEEDEVKVMIWDSLANRTPMADLITPVKVSTQ